MSFGHFVFMCFFAVLFAWSLAALMDGSTDAQYPLLRGTSIGAAVVRANPAYWISYRISEPHP